MTRERSPEGSFEATHRRVAALRAATLGRCAVVFLLLASGPLGCSVPRATDRGATLGTGIVVDPGLRSEVDRFRSALQSRFGTEIAESGEEPAVLFGRALQVIVQYYVDSVDPVERTNAAIAALDRYDSETAPADSTPTHAAIAAMVSSLTPDSIYLYGDAYRGIRSDSGQVLGSVGLELTKRNRELMIISAIHGGPAWRAGVTAQDYLVAIDGARTDRLTLREAIGRLRGPVESKLTLTVRDKDSEKESLVTVAREVVSLPLVVDSALPNGVAYIRVDVFVDGTSREIYRTLSAHSVERDLNGVILDLRNNPGGPTNEAATTANLFLRSGLILQERGRTQDQVEDVFADGSGRWHAVPMVVLINRGTAGGSEVVAAALQSRSGVTIAGTASPGHGTSQTIFPISEDSALYLTTSRGYAANGRAISLGIQPDEVIEQADLYPVDLADDVVVKRARELLAAPDASPAKQSDRDAGGAAQAGVAGEVGADCLRFESANTEIVGALIERHFPGPPNYESVARGDVDERAFIVELGSPVCVEAEPGEEAPEAPLSGVCSVHVYSTDIDLGRFVGKRLVIRGRIFEAFTGHHHAPVVLEVTSVRAE